MTDSILDNTKKLLGLDPSYTAFDTDVILHINSVFVTLQQLGIGPDVGFMIEDNTATWASYTSSNLLLNNIKTYMYLRVRLLFDSPQLSFVIENMNQQIQELEWRMNVNREGTAWTDPNPPSHFRARF